MIAPKSAELEWAFLDANAPFAYTARLSPSQRVSQMNQSLVNTRPSLQWQSQYTIMALVAVSFLVRLLFQSSQDLLVQEAYYWNYAQHLDFGYLDHPPMVAVLIFLSTKLFGMAEWAVRIAALLCWGVAAWFTHRWSERMAAGSGMMAVLLLAVLPFFFILSLIITPDIIVTACWAAACYYLYLALVEEQAAAWLGVGVSLGLGMLSKYTIALLALPIFFYLLGVPEARQWFLRKEPYFALVLSILIFTPVIYWNATHDWVSFAFQSTRRFSAHFKFGLPAFLGLLLLFLTPVGLKGLYQLLQRSDNSRVSAKARFFLFSFTLFPLGFFAIFSLNHQIKFDWIGPTLLPLLPWFASQVSMRSAWMKTAIVLVCLYSLLTLFLVFGMGYLPNLKLFSKIIDWQQFTISMNHLARDVEKSEKTLPYLAALDPYNTNSELAYYQSRLTQTGQLEKAYPLQAAHLIGMNSLMYRYWLPKDNMAGKTVIFISKRPQLLAHVAKQVHMQSDMKTVWTKRANAAGKAVPYYVQVAKLPAKPSANRSGS